MITPPSTESFCLAGTTTSTFNAPASDSFLSSVALVAEVNKTAAMKARTKRLPIQMTSFFYKVLNF
jgi:hypothetical protein